MGGELIDPATAAAAGEAAKAAGKAIDLTSSFGSFLGRMFGAVPEDVVGLLGGDLLHHVRLRNCARLEQRTEEILCERGVSETVPLSPSVAIPLLEAAKNESREELQELWARLLAAAMDPNRDSRVRQSFVTTVKQLDPLDALILNFSYEITKRLNESSREPSEDFAYYLLHQKENPNQTAVAVMSKRFSVSEDEIMVSCQNLTTLNLVANFAVPLASFAAFLSPTGRTFMRALYD
jgi:hypothetical protein